MSGPGGDGDRRLQAVPSEPAAAESPEALLQRVARGDSTAFAGLYDALSADVFGMTLRVLRDRAQAEEVTQEVFLELWRTATRYDVARGGVRAWALTLAHRRAVDRVRSEQSASDRDDRAATRDAAPAGHDEVAETVALRLEHEQVRRCMGSLSDLQREAVTLAYWRGYTHAEVASVLTSPLGTVKTRIRDGLVRLRDCLGVPA